ncbi:MAG: methylenetetrahydrofolate reductase [Rhizobiaceae bacterium]
MSKQIPASIEVGAQHVHNGKLEAGMLPPSTRVYITDVGVDPLDAIVGSARMVTDMGYSPVPHIPARRIESEGALEERLSRLVNEAGVSDVLIIAGEAEDQMGPYSQSLEVLRTGLVDKFGITHVGVGGHPEGNVAYGKADVSQILKDKIAFGAQSDAEYRIVTQFGFDGSKFVQWAKSIADSGIDTPIHLGIAGPARVTTLIKYAAMCGVGNSLSFFKKRTGSIAQLATKHSPEEVARPIENAWKAGTGNIAQMHIFPFGGLQASADWLTQRGSFVFDDGQVMASA